MNRITKLLKKMEKVGVSAYLVTDPIDLYYLTGLEISQGQLLITSKSQNLIVDGRYFEAVRLVSSVPVLLSSKVKLWELLSGEKELYIDSDKTVVETFLNLQKEGQESGITVKAVKSLTTRLRAIKDDEEIARLKKAAELGSEGFDFLLQRIQENVEEKELADELEFFWRKKGAKGVAFEPIIAFGENSALPHYRAGNAHLKRNEIALFDIGVLYDHYHSDMTRVVFFGKVSEKLQKIRDIVEEASKKAMEILKAGVTAQELDEVARSYIASKGYGDNFSHSLGHGVGLEIHEYPRIKNTPGSTPIYLEERMVITIEPGIYIPGLGGVRLEDTVLITSSGYENLTKRPMKYYA